MHQLREERAIRLIQQAQQMVAAGKPNDAARMLQSFIYDSARVPALRTHREQAFKGLVHIYFQLGREDRLRKVFSQFAGEYGNGQDPAFDDAYVSGTIATGTLPLPLRRRDRFLILIRQLADVLALPGLVAECGCFQGLSSYLMCQRIRQSDASFDGSGFRIFDSFQGLSEPGAEDLRDPNLAESVRISLNVTAGSYAASLDRVKAALSPFPAISYHPGWIPEAFPPDREERYRFVHVDVDLYQPTLASFEYFWERLVPGAVMVCDDYNWPGARQAVDEFCARVGVAADITPSYQAIVRRTG